MQVCDISVRGSLRVALVPLVDSLNPVGGVSVTCLDKPDIDLTIKTGAKSANRCFFLGGVFLFLYTHTHTYIYIYIQSLLLGGFERKTRRKHAALGWPAIQTNPNLKQLVGQVDPWLRQFHDFLLFFFKRGGPVPFLLWDDSCFLFSLKGSGRGSNTRVSLRGFGQVKPMENSMWQRGKLLPSRE